MMTLYEYVIVDEYFLLDPINKFFLSESESVVARLCSESLIYRVSPNSSFAFVKKMDIRTKFVSREKDTVIHFRHYFLAVVRF